MGSSQPSLLPLPPPFFNLASRQLVNCTVQSPPINYFTPSPFESHLMVTNCFISQLNLTDMQKSSNFRLSFNLDKEHGG